MTDYVLTRQFWAVSGLLRKQLNDWCRETGDHPRRLSLRKDLFDRLCAETADETMRQDESILKMIESFKIAGPNGYVVIERESE